MRGQVHRSGRSAVATVETARRAGLGADVVVVGGGIAGVLAAARLAASGAAVTVLERGIVGGGATVGNHGIVHSGTLYAQHHAAVIDHCQHAQALVRSEFPGAVIGVFPAVYYGGAERVDAVTQALARSGLNHHAPVLPPALAQHGLATGTPSVTVDETIVSSRQLLVDLVARAAALGVRILPWTPVTTLTRARDRWLVSMPGGRHLVTGTVVLAAGEGNRRLLAPLAPRRADMVTTRLEVMIYLPGYHPPGPVFCLDYGGPTLVPARGGALLSFHGAPRLDVDDRFARPVPLGRVRRLLDVAMTFPGMPEAASRALAYTCVKTEWADDHVDRWGSRPEHAVIDHTDDGLPGLLSVIPGKMTLAFHATRELTQQILGHPVPLAPPTPETGASRVAADGQVAVEPWRSWQVAVVNA